jgi:adenosylhomocysteine nucleosidase
VSAAAERRVAVITGLRAEARCLRGLDVAVAYSGGSSERARSEAARLVAEGASGLVSFGLAGGLVPELRPGDLLLPEAVLSPDGRGVPIDPGWHEAVKALLEAGRLRATGGALAGSDRVVATAGDKRALREATGAVAVDMESHEVAAAASAASVPFLIIRAVADPHDRVIPQAALETLRPDGKVRARGILGGAIRDPGQLIALFRLGRDSIAALATLRRAARLAGSGLVEALQRRPDRDGRRARRRSRSSQIPKGTLSRPGRSPSGR